MQRSNLTWRVLLPLLVCLPGAALGGEASGQLPGHTGQVTVIEPGKFAEPCFAMVGAERLEYRFNATAALDFNLHYHEHDSVEYPVNKRQLSADAGYFVADAARDYCLMWVNRGAEAVQLNYQFILTREPGG